MKVAVYFGSREIYQDMISATNSLLANSDVDKIYLLIEDDVFPYGLRDKIETINVSGIVDEYFKDSPNYNSSWTKMGLIRAALTKVFPDLDTILSIDCDTIVDKDISEIWDIPLDGCYYAGVKEPRLSATTNLDYVNAGVLLVNLKELREDKKDDEIIEFLNTKKLYFIVQDAINACCKGKIKLIPSCYNASDYTAPTNDKKIIHYAGIRGRWREYPLVKGYLRATAEYTSEKT